MHKLSYGTFLQRLVIIKAEKTLLFNTIFSIILFKRLKERNRFYVGMSSRQMEAKKKCLKMKKIILIGLAFVLVLLARVNAGEITINPNGTGDTACAWIRRHAIMQETLTRYYSLEKQSLLL